MTLIVANVFVAVVLAVLALHSFLKWRVLGPERRLKQRLADLARDKDSTLDDDGPGILRIDEMSRIPWLNRMLGSIDLARDLRRLIDQSGVQVTTGALLLIMLVCGEFALVATLNLNRPIVSAAGFIFCASLPLVYIMHRRSERMRRFSEQFPDAIDMMTSALKAGHALGRAMQLVALEAPDPIKTEFRKTFEEQNLGLPIRESLLNLADRVDNIDLKLFVTAVIIQRESGGNLTEILTKISGTIRARFALLGQIRVYTAQGRFTAWVLGLLPLVVGVLIYFIDPEYVLFHFKDPIGRVGLGFAVVLQIVGLLIVRRIVKMRVH
jgi:tight adherence protein B